MQSEALRPRARLSGQWVFRALLRSRRSARGERFLVQATANQKNLARLGIVVGKRVARRVVARAESHAACDELASLLAAAIR